MMRDFCRRRQRREAIKALWMTGENRDESMKRRVPNERRGRKKFYEYSELQVQRNIQLFFRVAGLYDGYCRDDGGGVAHVLSRRGG